MLIPSFCQALTLPEEMGVGVEGAAGPPENSMIIFQVSRWGTPGDGVIYNHCSTPQYMHEFTPKEDSYHQQLSTVSAWLWTYCEDGASDRRLQAWTAHGSKQN